MSDSTGTHDGRVSGRRLFLLGRDIQHSMSPPVWNGIFNEVDVPWSYELRDVEKEELPAILEELRQDDVLGCNVTMPYKQWAFSQAEVQDRWVRQAGVCNWLTWRNGRFHAANTDAKGTAALLMETEPAELTLVLGAGGACGAVLAALEGRTDQVVIASLTRAESDRQAARASGWIDDATAVDWGHRMDIARRADLIVNTTPIGMGGRPGSPLEDMVPNPALRVADVVYGRERTDLEKQADEWGVPFADGLAYLESQAMALMGQLGLDDVDPIIVGNHLERAVGRRSRWWTRARR